MEHSLAWKHCQGGNAQGKLYCTFRAGDDIYTCFVYAGKTRQIRSGYHAGMQGMSGKICICTGEGKSFDYQEVTFAKGKHWFTSFKANNGRRYYLFIYGKSRVAKSGSAAGQEVIAGAIRERQGGRSRGYRSSYPARSWGNETRLNRYSRNGRSYWSNGGFVATIHDR